MRSGSVRMGCGLPCEDDPTLGRGRPVVKPLCRLWSQPEAPKVRTARMSKDHLAERCASRRSVTSSLQIGWRPRQDSNLEPTA